MHPSEDSALQPSGEAVVVDATGLPALFEALRGRGYTVVGPTVRDGAITVAELTSAAELPFGWGVEAEAGRYRLRERADTAAFGHSAGPQSWKSVLHPARARLWSADRATGSVEAGEAAEPPRYALLPLRSPILPAPVLRRVDRKSRAAHLPAARARLPRLCQRA